MLDKNFLDDDFKPEPYWWDDARPTLLGDAEDELPTRCDVAVVGSGYAGLHAAIVLARAGIDVVVIDAEPLGFGASTRNGGMVSGGVNVGKHVDLDSGEEKAMLAEASLSYSWFEDFIQTEGIDADFQKTGRFVGAHCSDAWKVLAKRMVKLNLVAESSAYMVPAKQTREEIGSDYYRGGMVLERSGAVHPGKLYLGLLRVARDAGARLFGNVRAGAIVRKVVGLQLKTSRGLLTADKIIIATNGYTSDLSGWHQRRLVPIASYQVATEELGLDAITQLFPKHRMIADTKRLLYYFRPSPDRKRLLFGGRARYLRHDPIAGGLHLRRKLTAVFPQLAGVKLSHGWWGYVAYLRGGVPDMGEGQPDMLPGVYHALGCHGSGVVMMSWLGYQTGLLVSGHANNKSAFSQIGMAPFPLYRKQPWFLPVVGAYFQMRDWTDRQFDGKSSV